MVEGIPLEMALHIGSYVVAAVVFVVGTKYAMKGLQTEVHRLSDSIDNIGEVIERLRAVDARQDNRLTKVETEGHERLGWMKRIESQLSEHRSRLRAIEEARRRDQ